MDILTRSSGLWKRESTASLANPYFWIVFCLIAVIAVIYYLDIIYVKDHLEWLWRYRVFEYRFHANGILLYVPLITAAVVFGWAGITITWLAALIVTLPHIIYFSFDLNSLIYNIGLLTAPVLIVFLIVLILRWLERETRIYAEREAERQAFTTQILKAHEDERKNIARELHDDAIQTLLAIANRLEAVLHKEANLSPQVVSQLELSRDTVFRVSDDLRRLSLNLRPGVLDDIGLVEALRSLVNNFNDQTIKASLRVNGESRKLPAWTDVIVFRFIQEALNNTRRHSGATEVIVTLDLGQDIVKLRVEDNGRGFTVPKPISKLATANRFGIIGLQERARMLNGEFEIISEPGQGTTVTLEFRA